MTHDFGNRKSKQQTSRNFKLSLIRNLNRTNHSIPVARRAKLAEEAAGIEGVVGVGCQCCFVAAEGAAADVVATAAVSGCRCRPRMRFWTSPYSIDLCEKEIMILQFIFL